MTDLFDHVVYWRAAPLEAFRAFVKSQDFVKLARHRPYDIGPAGAKVPRPIRDSSAVIYTHMFATFARCMETQKLTLFDITGSHVREFLDATHLVDGKAAKRLNSSIRVRYLRLLERVFAHLHLEPNPARLAAYEVHKAQANGRDKPKAALTEKQQVEFMRALPEAKPDSPESRNDASWKRRRDRALLAMMLGGGLKVSEVIAIRTDRVGRLDATGSLPVTVTAPATDGTSKHHESIVRPFAAKEVLAWLAERLDRKIPGSSLFPASLQGGALSRVTVYRQAKATFARAGLEVDRKGGRTLRNSFAARELASGQPVELIKVYMGHHELRSTEKYILPDPTKLLAD